MIDMLNKQEIFSSNFNNRYQQQYNGSDQKSYTNYMKLTEKQIIIELKCLVAKQEQQINMLTSQIQRIKSHQFITHRSLRQDEKSPQSAKNKSSNRQNIDEQVTNSIRESKHIKNIDKQSLYLQELRTILQQFQSKVITPFMNKFQLNNNSDETIINQQNNYSLNKSNSKKKINQNIPSPSKNKSKSNKLIARVGKFQNLLELVHYMPNFLNDIKATLIKMEEVNIKNASKQKQMRQKIKNQQNMLQEIMKEYQKNIEQSEKIQKRLISQIKSCKNSSNTEHLNQRYTQKYKDQLIRL